MSIGCRSVVCPLLVLAGVTLLPAAVSGSSAEDAQAQFDKAFVLEDQKKFVEAAAEYEKLVSSAEFLDQAGWRGRALYRKGGCERSSGRFEDALSTYARMPQLFPQARERCASAVVARGDVYRMMKQWDNAVAEYRRVPQDFPGVKAQVRAARVGIADALNDAGRWDEAFAAMDDAINSCSDDRAEQAKLTCAKAAMQLDARHNKAALLTAQAAVTAGAAVGPDAARWAKFMLVQAQIEMGLTKQAMPVLEQLIADVQATPDEKAQFALLKGVVYFNGFNRAASAGLLDKFIDDYGSTGYAGEAYFHRAMLRVLQGNREGALADAEHVGDESRRAFALGMAHEAVSEWADAEAQYRLAIDKKPDPFRGPTIVVETAYKKLANCRERQGDFPGAVATRAELADFLADNPTVTK